MLGHCDGRMSGAGLGHLHIWLVTCSLGSQIAGLESLNASEGASFDPVKGVLHWQPKDDLVKKEGKLLL